MCTVRCLRVNNIFVLQVNLISNTRASFFWRSTWPAARTGSDTTHQGSDGKEASVARRSVLMSIHWECKLSRHSNEHAACKHSFSLKRTGLKVFIPHTKQRIVSGDMLVRGSASCDEDKPYAANCKSDCSCPVKVSSAILASSRRAFRVAP